MCSVWYQLEQRESAEVVQSDLAGPEENRAGQPWKLT